MSSAILELILKAKNEAGGVFGEVAGSLGLVGKAGSSATKDVEGLAGAGGKTGIGALGGALGGLISPLGIATVGIGALGAVGAAAMDTYEKLEVQEKALAIAVQTHGLSLEDEKRAIEGNQTRWEALGYTLSDVTPVFTKLTEAGLTQAQQLDAMTPIMDLARAKHITLEEATTAYTKGILGNVRALKEFGVELPKSEASEAALTKAQDAATKANDGLTKAQDALTAMNERLAGKTKLTTSEHLALEKAQEKVKVATDKASIAHDALVKIEDKAAEKGGRLTEINQGLEKAVGGQAGAIDGLAPKQAALNDKWEKFATTIGPAIQGIFGTFLDLLNGFLDVLSKVFGIIQDAVRAVTGFFDSSTPEKIAATASAKAFMGDQTAASKPNSGGMAGFAQGGIVPGAIGAPMLAIVHGGETITPAGRAGVNFGAGAIIVNGATDPQATAQAVMLAIKRELTRQGTSFSSGY